MKILPGEGLIAARAPALLRVEVVFIYYSMTERSVLSRSAIDNAMLHIPTPISMVKSLH